MLSSPSYKLLVFNPDSKPTPPNLDIRTQLQFKENNKLHLRFRLEGDLQKVKWPDRRFEDKRVDDLWQETCFELFIKPVNEKHYWEFNFSNDQYFNCYYFTDYRNGMKTEPLINEFDSEFKIKNQIANFQVEIDMGKLTEQNRLSQVTIGVSMVIKSADGSTWYYALQHGKDKPDFHDPGNYVILSDSFSNLS